ncbi:sugar nucleotide-binding protein [Sulfurimonas sediminis]|uniref:dTDP-4-dehydrorhamnose reductase n=1 Tax=Sulfurimonas sediminis TaxID=2590020 RepID=A0A7M1AYY2_9BACT|nr:sugar nucleotide-binding protein [Sulfurimonas sediminis]QOP42660.1 sugar nucleotide-binding protein [Sulfurimonas sediminis]
MIVGNGQLAQAFKNLKYNDNVVIYASGVANSNCTDRNAFEREKNLLVKTLIENKNKKFVYFSSCALSAKEYPLNDYYIHKKNMEKIIKEHSDNYYIFRVPQLFGKLKKHPTLINYLYNAIEEQKEMQIYKDAFRYVIDIEDVNKIVIHVINQHEGKLTLDIANSYRYSIVEIIEIIEKLTNKKAKYKIINKRDGYDLDLSSLYNITSQYNIDISFGKSYLHERLKQRIKTT